MVGKEYNDRDGFKYQKDAWHEYRKQGFSDIANESHAAIKEGTLKIDPATGTLSKTGTILIPKNHHYGA